MNLQKRETKSDKNSCDLIWCVLVCFGFFFSVFFVCLLGHVLFFLCFSSPARVTFGWKPKKKKKKKKTEDHKIRAVHRRCHARNTCTLHLQTRLSGRCNFFTVIARRKKNFLLLRSWIEVDDRVNVSNHYSKKHDARHSCTFAKALKTPQPLTPSCEN